jgi:MFS family permease
MDNKDDKIKKSLRYSIMDGFFASVMVGFGESFLSAFAVFLKASNAQLGLLGSLPQALGSLSQLFSHRLMKRIKSRQKIVVLGALLSALMYIPITLAFYFGELKVFHLIVFVCLYWVFASIISPAWNSWMGDLVPGDERGRYFGKRNKIAGFATFGAFLLAGFILQRFTGDSGYQFTGYAIIFITAMVARIVSMMYLTRKFEPEYHEAPEAYFSFIDFIKKARYNNYGIFTIYYASMNFGVFVAGPFFAAYMLNDLKLSYIEFTLVQAAAILMKNFAMPIWGKACDRFGTRKVLSLSAFLMPMVPILWVFSSNFWYLIIIQLYSGFVWAGLELSAFNFIFDITTPQKRANCVAYFNVVNGIAMFLGAMVGGLIVTLTPEGVLRSKFYVVFTISFIMRYLPAFLFIPKIKEVREVEHVPYHTLFLNVVTTFPTTGAFIFSFMHDVVQMPVKYKIPQKLEKEIAGLPKRLEKIPDKLKGLKKK